MNKTIKRTMGLVVVLAVMSLFMFMGITTKVANAVVFTNNLFMTQGTTLTNNAQITEGGRMGTKATPSRDGANVRIDRDLVGLTEIEFGIVDDTGMGNFTVSYSGAENGFVVDFYQSGGKFFATVIENGATLGEVEVANTKYVTLSFDANSLQVSLDGTKICDVESIMPTYEVVYTFNDVDLSGDEIIFFAINSHGLAQPVMTNNGGPTIFADFETKGVVNHFYTLPKPYGCDVIDGAITDFEVQVTKGSETILAKTAYVSDLGFTPTQAGSYEVTYYAKDVDDGEESQTLTLTVITEANFMPTEFSFDGSVQNQKLGVNSSIFVPNGTATSLSISKFSCDLLLTIKKDDVTLPDYNLVKAESVDKFTFATAGEYEFRYVAQNKNVIGETVFNVTVTADLPQIDMPNFKDYYITNDEIELPSVKLTLNGTSVDAESIIVYPVSKTATFAKKAVLSENGLYTIEYRGVIGGKMYVYSKNFTVYSLAYETKDGSSYYGESTLEKGTYGVVAKLSTGSMLTLNEPINLSGMGANNQVLVVDITPSTLGASDFMQLNVRFTDIYDENNYVTISCRRSRDEDGIDQRMSYVKAGYKNQAQVGLEGGKTPYYEPSPWGEYISVAFNGNTNNSFIVSFDYDNRTIYANGKKIIELNNPLYFNELWDGFTTGECYVTISAQDLLGMEANVLITKVGDLDLTKSFIKDDVAPEIEIETDFALTELPNAVVGTPYKVFDATAYDLINGETDVITSVYYAYTSSSKAQINVINGAFTPIIAGRYTIEYKAVDASGNVGIKTAIVYAYDSLTQMTVTTQSAPSGAKLVGHDVAVANCDVFDYSGEATVNIIAKHKTSNKEYDVVDFKFVPHEQGDYKIIYTATDYIGRTAQTEYEITVTSDGLAVIRDEAILPFVMIQGARYELPKLNYYTYANGVEQTATAKIFVKDANGTNEVTGEYVPSVTTSGENAEITYKATTASGDTVKTYYVPVQIVKTGASYDMTQYFIGEGITTTSNENNVMISTLQDTTVKFINPLIAGNFNFDFNVAVDKNAFSGIDVFLTDMFDQSVRVKFSYVKGANGVANMSLNDGVAVASSSSFTDVNNSKFVISYDDVGKKLNDILGNGFMVNRTIYGAEFNGFPSGRVYLEFSINGVTAQSQININSINSQNFTNRSMDTTRPQIAIEGVLGGTYAKDSTYAIPVAYALDVLDPTVVFTLSVTSPSGETVSDTLGNALNNVDPSVARNIVVTESGVYTFTYTAKDTSNRQYSFSTIINVPDMVAPTIEISGSVSGSASVNKAVAFPKATAYKNGEVYMRYNEVLGSDQEVNVVVFVICPNTRREIAKRNESNGKYNYTFTQKGEHTVVYVVYDESGNSAEQRFTVKVS